MWSDATPDAAEATGAAAKTAGYHYALGHPGVWLRGDGRLDRSVVAAVTAKLIWDYFVK